MTFAENLTATMKPLLKGMHDDGYSKGLKAGSKIDTSDATATAADIDYDRIAYAKGQKITGTKQRREYSGTLETKPNEPAQGAIVGSYAYLELAKDELLKEIREYDTLFIRVEFDIDLTDPTELPKYTIVKTWATNVDGELIPAAGNQLVYRINDDPKVVRTNLLKKIYDDPPGIGFVHITEDGELRIYSGSLNYAIRPSNFKVIVEW